MRVFVDDEPGLDAAYAEVEVQDDGHTAVYCVTQDGDKIDIANGWGRIYFT